MEEAEEEWLDLDREPPELFPAPPLVLAPEEESFGLMSKLTELLLILAAPYEAAPRTAGPPAEEITVPAPAPRFNAFCW